MIEKIDFHDFIEAITVVLDAKDPYTCGHSIRVSDMTCVIARCMNCTDFDEIHFAAHLHDIGKIGVSETVLRKPGRLTCDEYAEVQRHSVIGEGIISRVKSLAEIASMIRSHHERFDGLGYPDGLAGNAIPLGSRIIAIADSIDAMTSFRPYRKPISFEDAFDEIVAHSGHQFDPEIVAAAIQCKVEIETIVHSGPPINVYDKLAEIEPGVIGHSMAV